MPAPTIDDVEDYLAFDSCGDDPSWTRGQIESTLAAETAAQAAVCRIPTPMPADLNEALCRRVAQNLSFQALSATGLVTLVDSSLAAMHAAGLDPMVRRLEAPYRKHVVG
jgi:hypothetical protein